MQRMLPLLPMQRIEPALPMLRIEPALPMLRTEPALPMLRTLNMLPTLPTLNKLPMPNEPARPPALPRDTLLFRPARTALPIRIPPCIHRASQYSLPVQSTTLNVLLSDWLLPLHGFYGILCLPGIEAAFEGRCLET